MIDPYGMVLKMTVEGHKPEQIAAATGWPVDAVTTLQEEVAHERKRDMHSAYFEPSIEDEDAIRRFA